MEESLHGAVNVIRPMRDVEFRRGQVVGTARFVAHNPYVSAREQCGEALEIGPLTIEPGLEGHAQMVIRDTDVEPMTGIEPAYSAWEADVLPLNYIGMVPLQDINPAR